MKKHVGAIFLYIITVTISFFLFLPNIQKDVPYSNVGNIFMLTTLSIWYQVGPSTYHWSPVQTFPEAKKGNHYYKRLEDKRGNNYYISHPPGAFVFTFIAIKLLSLPLVHATLQYIDFTLFLLLLTLIAFWLYKKFRAAENFYFLFFSLLIISLASGPVWYLFTYHLFAESWGFFFFLGWLLWLDLWENDRKKIYVILLYVFSALLAYTDWMGLCLVAVGFYYVIFSKMEKKQRLLWLGWMLTMVLVYAGVVLQYVSIAGVEKFGRALLIRFVERSGYFGADYTDMGYHVGRLETWKLFLLNFWHATAGPLLLLILLVLMSRKKDVNKSDFREKIISVAWMSVVLYSLVLFSATATHYIYAAKWIVPLFVTIVFWVAKVRLEKKAFYIFSFFAWLVFSWGYYDFLRHKPHVDLAKQAKLNSVAEVVGVQKLDTLKFLPFYEERDIIYLSWRSKRNLVWKKDSQ
jgi:hypothetical protein